jgi:hypothetical protein
MEDMFTRKQSLVKIIILSLSGLCFTKVEARNT